jgi:hypothetical protein
MNAMQKKTGIIALLVCGFIAAGQVSHADTRTDTLPPVPLTADPQYVIINFADPKEQFAYTFQTSEASYEAVIKPSLQSAIMEFRDTLGAGTDTRRYAWSTIHTYNEYPQSSGEAYLTYVERMLDLAEETDVPVFIPLNGFQWWNQMPELWNWFDPDGNAIAGCTNADYAECPFPELRDPAYRARYIAGYNPENRYNVEWQDVSTPMMPNWRNWGGGAFMHAPIPNLIHHSGAETSFRKLQEKRVDAITKLIAARVAEWHQNGKAYLFAGLSIGTEVSLHATLEPDGPFLPYGYRGMQDYLLTTEAQVQAPASTAALSRMSEEELRQLREAVVSDYLNTLAAIAVRNGLPKQRIYTHVASEFEPDKPETYVNYFRAAQSYFARPGLSLYPFAANPFLLDPLDTTLAEYGEPAWAVPETQLPALSWNEGVPALLANDRNSAKLIVVYNEREIRGGEAIEPLRQILSQEQPATESCTVPEIQATISSGASSQGAQLPWYQRVWDYLSGYTEDQIIVQVEQISSTVDALPRPELMIFDEAVPLPDTAPFAIATASSSLNASQKTAQVAIGLPRQLDAGTYTLIVKQTGCEGRRWTTATPLTLDISEDYNARWWSR